VSAGSARARHTGFTVGGRPFLSVGGQARNSSAFTPEDAEHACRSVVALGGNTVALPVSWEGLEPREGEFDTGVVRALVDRARRWDLHLVLLWFATWKNGTSEYAPAWVKSDAVRFPRTRYANGEAAFVLSAHAAANRAADARAFRVLMETVRDHDAATGTVLAVQVENEPGIYAPTRRDFGPDGERDFRGAVPAALVDAARDRPDSNLGRWWRACGSVPAGTWTDVLGTWGAEACTTWAVARYTDHVAAAGREVHDLPLTVNAWLDTGMWGLGGLDYPCGGPVHSTPALDIWRATARSVDMICPDVYVPDPRTYRDVVDAYAAPEDGWPLFVPESANRNPNPAFMFHAIGTAGAVGQHVFGVEELVAPDGTVREEARAFCRSFAMLRAAEPLIHRFREGSGTSATGVLCQEPGQRFAHVALDGWLCTATYSGAEFRWNGTDFRHMDLIETEFADVTDLTRELGRGLVFQTARDEVYLVGHGTRVFLNRLPDPDGSIPLSLVAPVHQAASMPTLSIEEGRFVDGEFVAERLRTGDEARHGIWLAADCGVVRVVLHDVDAAAAG